MNKTLFLWINLDRSSDRREYMENLFDKHSVHNVRIQAMLGDDLGIDRATAASHSHKKAINYFYTQTNEEHVIICEDDISFEYKEFWTQTFDDVIASAPSDWEVIQMGITCNNLYPEFYSENKYVETIEHKHYGSFAYAINRKGAEKVLNYKINDKIRCAPDNFIYFITKSYTYTRPMITYSTEFDSDAGSFVPFHIEAKNVVTAFLQENK